MPEDTIPKPTRRKRTVRPGSKAPLPPDQKHMEKRRRGRERDIQNAMENADMMAANAPAVPAKKVSIRPDMMGNRLWMLRNKDVGGIKRRFETPEDMRVAVLDYFAWNDTHPLTEHKVTHHQGQRLALDEPKMRAMTQTALCLHIGLNRSCWKDYGSREGYEEIVRTTNEAIYAQKFEGAAAGLLSPNVIIRDLGLKDRTDLTSDDEGVTGILRKVIEASGSGPKG